MHMLSPSGVRFVRRLLSNLDTPRSLTAWLLFKSKEWDQLVNLRCDPLQYCPSALELIVNQGHCPATALKYRDDAQASDLLRKIPFDTTFDRRKAAMVAWNEKKQGYRWGNTMAIPALFALFGMARWRARKKRRATLKL
jgi:hypothetical protein